MLLIEAMEPDEQLVAKTASVFTVPFCFYELAAVYPRTMPLESLEKIIKHLIKKDLLEYCECPSAEELDELELLAVIRAYEKDEEDDKVSTHSVPEQCDGNPGNVIWYNEQGDYYQVKDTVNGPYINPEWSSAHVVQAIPLSTLEENKSFSESSEKRSESSSEAVENEPFNPRPESRRRVIAADPQYFHLVQNRLKFESINEARSHRDAQLSARHVDSMRHTSMTLSPSGSPLKKFSLSEENLRAMPRLLRPHDEDFRSESLRLDRRSITGKNPRLTLANLMSAIRDPAVLSRDVEREPAVPPPGEEPLSSNQYGPSSTDMLNSVEREHGDGRSRDTGFPSEDDEVWSTLEEMALEGEIFGMHPDGNPMFYRFTSTAFQHVLADLLPAEERNHMAHLARIVVAIRKYYGLTFLINQVKQRERQARMTK
eukprot:Gregarina_sp_Poly_1__2146@NODE_156_length_12377_cov_161_699350_g138_i0_p5_GENE_NODE_156_length_12377_cov_161_699350_g138_i0NODE_156_length_12377_cov_161_699350_g138_i0_p5_ORF_typecomplete_len428_score80_48_NODE_156_length_12377_cov_161_699350_g138_i070438326